MADVLLNVNFPQILYFFTKQTSVVSFVVNSFSYQLVFKLLLTFKSKSCSISFQLVMIILFIYSEQTLKELYSLKTI